MVGIVVPLYAWPTPDVYERVWKRVKEAARSFPDAPLVVIVNPSDGPGQFPPHEHYIRAVQLLKAQNINIIGYVKTEWGSRNIKDVKRDIDLYSGWATLGPNLALNGIFVDEAPNAWMKPEEHVSYYEDLYKYIRNGTHVWGTKGVVMLNPGSHTIHSYLKAGDILVVFENYYDARRRFPMASYWEHMQFRVDPSIQYCNPFQYRHPLLDVRKMDRSRLAGLVFECEGEEEMKNAVNLAIERRIGWIYVTDDHFEDKNPWDTIPAYWESFVKYVDQRNKEHQERVRTKSKARGCCCSC